MNDDLTKRKWLSCNDYHQLALRTECDQVKSYLRLTQSNLDTVRLNHAILGLIGEIGEIHDCLDSRDAPNKLGEIDIVNLLEEIGDSYWYLNQAISATRIDPQHVFNNSNIEIVQQFTVAVQYHTESENKDWDKLVSDLRVLTKLLTRHVSNLASKLEKAVYYGKAEESLTIINDFRYIHTALLVMGQICGEGVSDIWIANLNKLKIRYPDKYTDWNADEENRERGKEREAMELTIQNGHGWAEPPEIG